MTAQWAAGELITASKLNTGLFFRRNSIADLQAVNTALYTESYYCCYVYQKGIYYHDPASSVTADGYYIIQPTTGGGRWFLLTGDSLGQSYADYTALKAVVTTGLATGIMAMINDTGLYRFDSTSSLTEDLLTVIAPTSGTGRWILFLAQPDILLGMIDYELQDVEDLKSRISDLDNGVITVKRTLSWTSISTILIQNQAVTVLGVRPGDLVMATPPVLDGSSHRIGIHYIAVTADDTITVGLRNNHTSSLTPSTGVWTFEIRRLN